MKKYSIYLVITIITLSLFSCNEKKSEDENKVSDAKTAFKAEKNLVDTIILRKVDFNREIISNGNLNAVQKAELYFPSQGEIEAVYVGNGSAVKKGDILVKLNNIPFKLKLDQAQSSLEKAELDFKDNIIGYGYGLDTNNIPKEQLKVAKIKSGLITAQQNYLSAKRDFDNATLSAPFSGVVANLNAKPHEMSKEAICTIIDNSSFNVDFKLLESELSFIKKDQSISIYPFSDPTKNYRGRIKFINPLVDEKGQIKITASVDNKGDLIEGMNVRVFIESKSKGELVVPKSAVVIRDGYDVLFTYNPDNGKAGWVYVDVLSSNSSSHIVRGNQQKSARLDEGESIIISGNLNLANDSNVEIKRK